jgi:hypothetical protein
MADWPKDALDLSPFGSLSTAGEGAMLADFVLNTAGGFTNAGNGLVANQALYVPVIVRNPLTVYQLGWVNGTTVAGNLDVGIYDRNSVRLVSSGSTAQATINVAQVVDIADTTLAPDFYYLALAGDNPGTQNLIQISLQVSAYARPGGGVNTQATAFPLPSTATMTPFTANQRVPLIFGAIEGATF